jgi:PAS domain S-box-containing protein
MVFSLTAEGRLLTMNRGPLQALGYQPRDVLGRHLLDFVPPGERGRLSEEFLGKIRRDGETRVVTPFLAKDGAERVFDFQARLLRDGTHYDWIVGSGHDITERVLAERHLREMEEELGHSRKMEAIGTLASGVAHGFNNLLQIIVGYTELAIDSMDPRSPPVEYLKEVHGATDRAQGLVKGLLAFSRRVKPVFEPVDLNRCVVQAVEVLQHTIPRMVRIETSLAENLNLVEADATQLGVLLVNLGTNARDAMPEGGTLRIETGNVVLTEPVCEGHRQATTGPDVRLVVSDTGCGMTEETAQRIFEPFFTTKEVGQGTGLGLSAAYGIVRAHGGQMICKTAVGQGATFEVFLPSNKGEVPREEGLGQPQPAGQGRGQTILLVDDEVAVLEPALQSLVALGYQVLTATSGEEALERFDGVSDRVALVVLDLGMPGMGGRRCLAELLRIDPNVNVLVASGYSDSSRKTAMVKAGAKGFIPKPYRLRKLAEKIQSIIDEESPRS